MEKDIEEMETKKARPFQKFLLLVLIPLLFAISVGLIVATAAGVNVFDKAKAFSQKIPIAGGLFQTENAQSIKTIEKNVSDLQAQLKDRDAEISQFQEKLDSKDQELQKAQLETQAARFTELMTKTDAASQQSNP
jgi:peptidoglycan hydrolase CwlO-like protein